jgi:hypothetical protein
MGLTTGFFYVSCYSEVRLRIPALSVGGLRSDIEQKPPETNMTVSFYKMRGFCYEF